MKCGHRKAFVFERKLFTHLAEFQVANIIFQVVSRFFEDQIRDSFYRGSIIYAVFAPECGGFLFLPSKVMNSDIGSGIETERSCLVML